MLDIFQEIDFKLKETKPELADNAEFLKFLQSQCAAMQKEADLTRKRPVLDISYDACALVIGLPVVGAEKKAKLEALFTKRILPPHGLDTHLLAIDMELDESGSTTGTAIFTMSDSEKAIELVAALDKLRITPEQSLVAMTFSKISEVSAIIEEEDLCIPKAEDVVEWRKLCSTRVPFMCFSKTRILLSEFNGIKRVSGASRPLSFPGNVSKVLFSPSGNYLALIFSESVVIRGGTKFSTFQKLSHFGITNAVFSRQEQYLITISGVVTDTKSNENAVLWSLTSGQKLRAFRANTPDFFANISFSYDDKYLCALIEKEKGNLVGVYTLPEAALLKMQDSSEKRPLEAEQVVCAKWATTRNSIAVLCGGSKSDILLFDIPSRARIRWINFTYELSSGSLEWACADKFLLGSYRIKVKRKHEMLVQTGKVDFAKKRVFVNVLSLDPHPHNFFLSPSSEFLISILPQKTTYKISAYSLESLETRVQEKTLLELPEQIYDRALFSPQSKFVLLEEPRRKQIFFCEFKRVRSAISFKLLREVTLTGYQECSWSPCGRYLAVKKSFEGVAEVTFFDCFGSEIITESFKRMSDFMWRPWDLNLSTAFSPKQIKEIKEEIKTNFGKLLEEDSAEVNAFQRQQAQLRKAKCEEITKYVQNFSMRLKEHLVDTGLTEGDVSTVSKSVVFAERFDKEEVFEERKLSDETALEE